MANSARVVVERDGFSQGVIDAPEHGEHLAVIARLIAAPAPPIHLEPTAAAVAFAAMLAEQFEPPQEEISVFETQRRYEAALRQVWRR